MQSICNKILSSSHEEDVQEDTESQTLHPREASLSLSLCGSLSHKLLVAFVALSDTVVPFSHSFRRWIGGLVEESPNPQTLK